MTTHHGINLDRLDGAQIKQLAADAADQLERRRQEDRVALEEKLRLLAEEHGFNPKAVRLAGKGKRTARRSIKNEKDDTHE